LPSSFTSVVRPIPSDLSGFQAVINLYAVYYETLAFYVLWAVTVVTVIVIAGFTALKWRIPLQLAMLLALVCFLIQIIVTLLFMVLSGFLGNLCRNPTYTILNLLPAGSLQVRSFCLHPLPMLSSTYYSHCCAHAGPGYLLRDVPRHQHDPDVHQHRVGQHRDPGHRVAVGEQQQQQPVLQRPVRHRDAGRTHRLLSSTQRVADCTPLLLFFF